MNVVAIVQARVDSTRLPGKMLLPLGGKPVIQNVMERVIRATRLTEGVILAYPLKDHDAFKPVIDAMPKYTVGTPYGIYAYQGDENDLVDRYLMAAMSWHADIIVRIPGDNPCIQPEYIDRLVDYYMEEPCVFATNTVALLDTDSDQELWIDGLGAEILSRSRLQWLDLKTQGHAEWREHPHQWFYDTKYPIDGPDALCWDEQTMLPPPDADLRLDINTQADYDFINDIYAHFGNNTFHVAQVLEYLHGRTR